jgi:anti-sigma regulatory factor (Ser/Thr protein kinase)
VLGGQCSSEQLSKAQVALSEVVNNAVQHGPEKQDPIELEILHVDGLVTVRVIQPGPVPERPSIVSMPEA